MSRKLNDISANYDLAFYTNENNIGNQDLVKETIWFFEATNSSEVFTPLDFLNLLYKQFEFVKNNVKKGPRVILHLKALALTEYQKHMLYGFILKWFGGYPVNNLDKDFDNTLKLIESEFLAYPIKTDEKEFCKSDTQKRKQFMKLSIAATTGIRYGIDITQIYEALEEAPIKRTYNNFEELFADVVKYGSEGQFDNTQSYFIEESRYAFQFNLWLEEFKGWKYGNESQYRALLTKDNWMEFLQKQIQLETERQRKVEEESLSWQLRLQINQTLDISKQIIKRANHEEDFKLSLRQIALFHAYTDQPITEENGKGIASKYGWGSGQKLYQHYNFYCKKQNRIYSENTTKRTYNKVELMKSILPLLMNHPDKLQKAKDEIKTLESKILTG